jgi:hypothetical protein
MSGIIENCRVLRVWIVALVVFWCESDVLTDNRVGLGEEIRFSLREWVIQKGHSVSIRISGRIPNTLEVRGFLREYMIVTCVRSIHVIS